MDVEATIIGFDQDGINTITWITTQGLNNYGPVLSTSFSPNMGTTANDGYNYNSEYSGSSIWQWLNGSTNSICQAVDTEFKSIILPVQKISRPLYVVKNTDNTTYHKYGYDTTTQTSCGYHKQNYVTFASKLSYNSDYSVPDTIYDKYHNYGTTGTNTGGDPFWLPSLYELGFAPDDYNTITDKFIDEPETSAYQFATYVQGEMFDIYAEKYESIRVTPSGTNINDDIMDIPEFTYDYFKQDISLQNIFPSQYLLCRSYFAVTSDDITDASVTFDTEELTDLYSKYATARRICHVVSITGDEGNTHLYACDKDTAPYVGGITAFCFVTH